MYHSRPLRNVAIILASAYLCAAVAVVATGHKPVCRVRDAVIARSAADRSSAIQDYPNAERNNLAAARAVLACGTLSSAELAFISVGRAATAYGQHQYFYALSVLDAARSNLASAAGQSAGQGAQRPTPFQLFWHHGNA